MAALTYVNLQAGLFGGYRASCCAKTGAKTSRPFGLFLELETSLVGQTVSHYRILDRIGSGGMGAVYKAEDSRLQRVVALKFLAPNLLLDEGAKQRFVTEARAASKLDHPNICTLFEILEDSEYGGCIAMAYYEGKTVRDLLRRGPIAFDDAIGYARQTLTGLAKAHSAGIVHRDIKPENLIITKDGILKILDFGVAKFGSAGPTRAGDLAGTFPYMSPEQIRGEQVDNRTDIWSTGVVLYEMLTGTNPFHAEYPQAAVYSILNVEPRPLRLNQTVLPSLNRFLKKVLERERENRFQYADEAIEQIDAIPKGPAEGATVTHVAQQTESAVEVPAAASLTTGSTRKKSSVDLKTDGDDPLHLLLVDDEPELELLVRQKFRSRIRNKEWVCHFALDGNAALEFLRSRPDVSIVLTDINMPGMDGLTLIKEIEELDRPVRTVVVSAYGDLSNIRTAMNRGAFDFVTKPVDFGDLETTVLKTEQDLKTLIAAGKAAAGQHVLMQEVDVALNVQDSTLPEPIWKNRFANACAFFAPESDVSGDFYDYFEVDERHVGLVSGTVSGPSVSSALLAFASRSLLGTALRTGPPDGAVSLYRDAVSPILNADVTATVFCGILDAAGRLTYCNWGHPQPRVLRGSGGIEPIARSASRETAADRNEPHDIETAVSSFEDGDCLILYSPGLTQLLGAAPGTGPSERVDTLLGKTASTSPVEIVQRIAREVSQIKKESQAQGDVTVVAMRYTSESESSRDS